MEKLFAFSPPGLPDNIEGKRMIALRHVFVATSSTSFGSHLSVFKKSCFAFSHTAGGVPTYTGNGLTDCMTV